MHKKEIFELFNLLDGNFEIQNVYMDSYLKKGKYLIYCWSVSLTMCVSCMLGNPLFQKNKRYLLCYIAKPAFINKE